jgi:hypothetical protein
LKEEMISVNNPLFKLGQIVATPAALEALGKASQAPWEFLARHAQGDWGDLDAEDRRLNDEAVNAGERILSAYLLKSGVRIWIITEADRSSTCLLLPDEY